ncbi:hypothetical protein GZH47_00775 [Paenibacillus rhizovicinus]|uniref:Uncharacterized protein n=1 Tax=Paenibacillus rhizovicinus TaxID=2704463 RepID=A0A6C0NTG7_9BACL|nr:hypothetical protein [Paenibacillus rhizovicinus]QHW29509.1 hypothetical protein GZH47_00775 [Paenibacillus rhizovicinus]
MGQLIDARTSSNITVVLDSFDTFPLDTPVIVGQVGLNIPTATPGIIRVQLTGFRLYGLIGVINDSHKK